MVGKVDLFHRGSRNGAARVPTTSKQPDPIDGNDPISGKLRINIHTFMYTCTSIYIFICMLFFGDFFVILPGKMMIFWCFLEF